MFFANKKWCIFRENKAPVLGEAKGAMSDNEWAESKMYVFNKLSQIEGEVGEVKRLMHSMEQLVSKNQYQVEKVDTFLKQVKMVVWGILGSVSAGAVTQFIMR